jgi:hydrogenase expression/formation protein HypC
MCLAIPMKIIQKEGERAMVEAGGLQYEVNLSLLPEAGPGDFVLVHAGFAIQRLDEKEAGETLALWKELPKPR